MPRLCDAADRGDAAAVAKFLREGDDPNERDQDLGFPALVGAAMYGHTGVIKALLEAHADVDAANNDGRRALHSAAKCGHPDAIKALLEAHPDVNAAAKFGNRALHEAAMKGHDDIALLLLDAGAEVDPRNAKNSTPLLLGA